MKGIKYQAIFEIFLVITSVIAFSYVIRDVFGQEGIVSAQPQEDYVVTQEWRDAFQGESDDQIIGRMETYEGNLNSAIAARDAFNEFYSDPEEFRNDQTEFEENGQVTDSFSGFLGFLEGIIPDLGGIFGGSGLFDGGVSVCTIDNDDAICQSYLSGKCDENCKGECINAPNGIESLPDSSDCALGTCFMLEEGTCSVGGDQGGGATKLECERGGFGKWYAKDDPKGAELCQQGCCYLGDQSVLTTSGDCTNQIDSIGGIELEEGDFRFDPGLNDEYLCLHSLEPPELGACLSESLEVAGQNECQFISMGECLTAGGEFHENQFCSNDEFNTGCIRQNDVGCVEGKDEVYWFDSCGNVENIYDQDTSKSWNGGYVLAKEDSCVLGEGGNPIANQAACGNCLGASSFCAPKKEGDGNIPTQEIPGKDFVCLDRGCYDTDLLSNPVRRDHGESWCVYQSSIGLEGMDNLNLFGMSTMLPQNPLTDLFSGGAGAYATDTPGSRHFKKYCQNGDVKIAPCDDNRNEVCAEQQTPKNIDAVAVDPELLIENPQLYFEQVDSWVKNLPNVDFLDTYSQATCRTSRWGECFAYNPDVFESRLIGIAAQKKAGDLLKFKLDTSCGLDPDCFVKTVDLTSSEDDSFKFSYCAPRYPPGFGFSEEEAETGENFCAQGNSGCTTVFVKEAKTGGLAGAEWKCKANCDCVDYNDGDEPDNAKPSDDFKNQMNSLCVSLGDCGNQVNYLNSQPGGKGYKVCTGEDGECKGGLGGIGGDSGGGFLGFGGGGGALGNADPTPFEYIPAQNNNILGDILGDSVDKFLDDLGIGDLIDQFTGQIGQGAGVPAVGSGTNLGSAAGTGAGIGLTNGAIGALGNIPGASGVLYAFRGAEVVPSWTVTLKTPLTNSIGLEPANGVISHYETFTSSSGDVVSQIPIGETTITSTNQEFATNIVNNNAGAVATKGTSPVAAPASFSSVAAGFATSVVGGVVGSAITSFLIDALGIGAGIDPVTATVLTTAGGVAGSFGATALAHQAGWLSAPAWMGPVAIGMAVAIVVYTIYLKVIGVGEVKEIDVIFECQRWVPPSSGDCNSCGKDGLSDGKNEFPCSKYSCETIGQNCQFVEDSEQEETGGVCVVKEELDLFPPKVVAMIEENENERVLTSGFSYVDFEYDKKVEIVSDDGNCLSQYEVLSFGIELDEPGRCRMSAVPPSLVDQFDSMREVGGGMGMNQTIFFRGLDIYDLGYEGDLEQETRNDVTLFVACEDYYEKNSALNAFQVNLCITPEDISPPRFPESNVQLDPLPFDAETFDFSLPLNEPAQCRYGESYMSFDEMPEDTQCETVDSPFGSNYYCNFNQIPIEYSEGDYCVKCMDHPEWEGTDQESERHENSQCLTLGYSKSENLLSVELVSPIYKTNLIRGSSPATVEIEFRTSGGANDGAATCNYLVNGNNAGKLAETGGTTHTQDLTTLTAGNWKGTVYCNDGVNPVVHTNFEFNLEIDNAAPKITRVYAQNGNLVLVTNKNAECAYALGKVAGRNNFCNFHVDEAGEIEGVNLFGSISGSGGLTHQADFVENEIYYVKCNNEFGHETATCEMITNAGIIS